MHELGNSIFFKMAELCKREQLQSPVTYCPISCTLFFPF